MPKKRALEVPVEIRNEIDEQFMRDNFLIDGDWFWIPERLKEMTRDLTRESKLSANDMKCLKVKSSYRININTGSIYNVKTRVDKLLNEREYLMVALFLNGTTITYSHHIIVCFMKYGLKPSKSYSVDHIDRVKTNNTYTNLRYASGSQQGTNKGHSKWSKRDTIDEFIKKDYIKVKRVFYKGKVIKFKPTKHTKSIHLCRKGRYVIINKQYIGRLAILKKRYPCISFRGRLNPLHRLMFMNAHKRRSFGTIDHKDNNSFNWALNNLRECTNSQNALFAHREQNAHPMKCAVQIRNVLTGEIKSFPSKKQCSEFLHLTRHQSQYGMVIGSKIGDYQFIEIGTIQRKTGRRAVICDGRRFDSMMDCAKYLHQNYTPQTKLNSVVVSVRTVVGTNKTYKGFKIDYDDSIDEV